MIVPTVKICDKYCSFPQKLVCFWIHRQYFLEWPKNDWAFRAHMSQYFETVFPAFPFRHIVQKNKYKYSIVCAGEGTRMRDRQQVNIGYIVYCACVQCPQWQWPPHCPAGKSASVSIFVLLLL